MPLENLQKEPFQDIMQEHISNTIGFLFDENQEFGVACDIAHVEFDPSLPQEIRESLPPVTLFMLANYSLESATLDGTSLQFEAGFGSQNFGSLV
ncbi:hypothetical protein [Sulfurovum sp. bin170]|uniref:hypothetical protein n=1 Tax=Sulfurovum sp. bin170 TaxID=2695268 RepID=UPI0021083265|nr:hypothetical protein [Sulfurovum sp. bin170]